MKPKLYIHVGRATHFLKWEIPEFKKHFTLVRSPSKDVALLSFGPDVLREASQLPASKRFAVLFPGFGHNPVYNDSLRASQHKIIEQKFDQVFINKGPLELAYSDIDKITLYPFSVDTDMLPLLRYRDGLDSLIHISNDAPQKDWQRSENIMRKTGLTYEVYPPRDGTIYEGQSTIREFRNNMRQLIGLKKKPYLPSGYVGHDAVINKYNQYDGFVHVARDIKDRVHIDGKYTASLIEAGVTGSILFWHDTFGLGNDFETVFDLPLDEDKAAEMIINIKNSVDIRKHSERTREEMLSTFNVRDSVAVRAERIKQLL